MRVSPCVEVSSRARNAFLTALGMLVALVVVAIAARGSIPAGDGGARSPTQALLDILFTLYLLLIASSAVLLVYMSSSCAARSRRRVARRSGAAARSRRC